MITIILAFFHAFGKNKSFNPSEEIYYLTIILDIVLIAGIVGGIIAIFGG